MPVVVSTAISRIEYNDLSRQMYVTFRETGSIYTYCGVPRHVYEGFLRAGSKGTFFNDHIKDRYTC